MKPSAGACSAGLAVCLAGCSLPGTTYAQPPPAPRNAQSGGTITVGITPPGGIDPLDAYEPSGKLVAGLLCDTLVSIDPVTGDPVPGLVTSWQVSQNTVTLRLRHGVLMSNGHVLDARDVVQSLIELANPATASREAALMSEVQGYASLSQNLFAGTDAKLVGGPIVIDPFDLEIPLST